MKTSSKKSAQERQDAKVAWLMMSPALLILAVIALYPILRTFWLSLHEMSLKNPGSGYPFIGLSNYIEILSDQRAMTDIGFTLKFTVVTVVLEMFIGFAAALIMNRAFKGRGIDSLGDSHIRVGYDVEIYLQ